MSPDIYSLAIVKRLSDNKEKNILKNKLKLYYIKNMLLYWLSNNNVPPTNLTFKHLKWLRVFKRNLEYIVGVIIIV